MADRYDEALRVLNETPAPDQWDDIQTRAEAAATTEAHIIYLNGRRRGPRPGWPVLTAAAAVVVLALLGAVALSSRDTSTVTTDRGPTSPPQRTETTIEPRDPTTERDTTTGTAPRETEPEGVAPPPSSPEGDGTTSPNSTPSTGEQVINCLNVEFQSVDVPTDVDQRQHAPGPSSPEMPIEDAQPDVIGVFESSETQDRAVFVVASGGHVEDGVTRVPVPALEVEAETAYTSSNSWGVAQIITAPDGIRICTFTFFTFGLSEVEFTSFVQGLDYAA